MLFFCSCILVKNYYWRLIWSVLVQSDTRTFGRTFKHLTSKTLPISLGKKHPATCGPSSQYKHSFLLLTKEMSNSHNFDTNSYDNLLTALVASKTKMRRATVHTWAEEVMLQNLYIYNIQADHSAHGCWKWQGLGPQSLFQNSRAMVALPITNFKAFWCLSIPWKWRLCCYFSMPRLFSCSWQSDLQWFELVQQTETASDRSC